jgi:hypothetical protein
MSLMAWGFNILFFVFYSQWLVLCGFIALLGILVRNRAEVLDREIVKGATTVCKTLYEKKILSKKEYDFEVTQVSDMYGKSTFAGYLFIMSPIILILKRVSWLDVITLHLVRRWINVHRYKLSISNHASIFDRKIVGTCVLAAQYTGAVFLLLGVGAKGEVKNLIEG